MQYRYKIIVEYLGTGFSGWQRQNNAISVQQIIEEAIHRFSHEAVTIVVAGRTDAGVHAFGQVAHFDLSKYYEPHKIMNSINHFVKPHEIGIVDCENVSLDFHARFSAKQRHYLYKIINRIGKVVIDKERAWWIREKLNIDTMKDGASYLIGHHDFTSFRAKYCQAKSPIKTLSKIEILQEGDEILFYVSAPSFLYNMVRNIVGSLVMVGREKWKPEHIDVVLKAKNRDLNYATAPSRGLYFLRVDY